MRNRVEVKSERIVPEHGSRTEAMGLFDPEAEDCDSEEEHEGFDLQCGESLAIAVNRIGEDGFGIKPLLRRFGILIGRGTFGRRIE
jgi:hypothetical protein